jgi:prepilin-type N-terminal cleavage/methylation domain-containing protein/prepilin-type processing-associated H-X9-DG protein
MRAGVRYLRRAASPGFTLVELLIVLGVLAVLTTLAVPVIRRVSEQGRVAGCLVNLRSLGVSFQAYLNDHEQTFPLWELARDNTADTNRVTLDVGLAAYVNKPDVFRCPADRSKRLWETTGTSYFWNSALRGQRVGQLRFMVTEDASRIPVFGDKEGFHPSAGSKVNVLYADGRGSRELRFY